MLLDDSVRKVAWLREETDTSPGSFLKQTWFWESAIFYIEILLRNAFRVFLKNENLINRELPE